MSTIKTLTVVLTANSAEFAAGMDKAKEGLHKFLHSGGGKSITKSLGLDPAAITAISTGFLAAAKGGEILAEVGEKVFEVAGEVAERIADWVVDSTNAITAAYRTSSALGITTESYMGIGAAAAKAGVDVESFGTLMLKMEKNIGEVNLNGKGAADAMAMIGVNARMLANMGADKSFYAIADGIASLKNPTDQAVASTELFGKQGAMLLPLLNQGSAAIRETAAEAVKYGIAVNNIDASKIAASREAVQELQEQWEGIKNTLTIAVTPAILSVASDIQAIVPPATELGSILKGWVFDIAAVTDSLLDTQQVMVDIFSGQAAQGMKEFFNPEHPLLDYLERAEEHATALAKIFNAKSLKINPGIDNEAVENVKAMKSAIESMQLQSATAGLEEFNKKMVEFENKFPKSTAADIVTYANALGHLVAVTKQMADAKKITGFLDNLKESSSTAGLEGWAKVRQELENMGASAPDMMKAMHYQDVIDAAETHKKLVNDIEQAWKDNETPLEKYQTAMMHINELVQAGLNIEIAKRAAIKANQDLLTAYRSKDAGIVEAREVRFNQFPASPQRQDTMRTVEDILKTQKALQEKQYTEAQRTNTYLQNQGIQIIDIDGN